MYTFFRLDSLSWASFTYVASFEFLDCSAQSNTRDNGAVKIMSRASHVIESLLSALYSNVTETSTRLIDVQCASFVMPCDVVRVKKRYFCASSPTSFMPRCK